MGIKEQSRQAPKKFSGALVVVKFIREKRQRCKGGQI